VYVFVAEVCVALGIWLDRRVSGALGLAGSLHLFRRLVLS
jgi:hypothetical protein